MTSEANVPDDPADAAALAAYADGLLAAVLAALPGWVERAVAQRHEQATGRAPSELVLDQARDAGRAAVEAIEPPLRALLLSDVDAQRTNPLAILRGAVRHPTGVLQAAQVPPVPRDAQAEALFPDDPYDLTPATFADIDPGLHEPGLVWGAAKAHVVLRRRRRG